MIRAVRYECDVLIIGSGAGGATTAAILAEAGLDVLVVEEGPWVEQGSVVPFSLEQMDRQYRSGGVTVALGLPSIAYTEGRCAGGGTEVNSGLYRRPPAETLDRWRREYEICRLRGRRHRIDLRRRRGRPERADRAGSAHRGEREAPPRRGPHGVAPRRDPALDDLPRTRQRRRRQASEHDRDVSAQGAAGRRTRARRASARPARRARTAGPRTPS